jgi:geranylgeranyl diphosphate synthase type I
MTTYDSPASASAATFAENVDLARQNIERRIPELIESSSSAHLEEVPSSQLMQGVISQALVSSRGGKRLRALLTIAAGNVASHPALDQDAMLDIACAIEIFQTGALVHDDIIDDSDLRRGIPAAHRGLATIFSKFSRKLASDALEAVLTTAQATGNGLGIMLGDLLATESLLVISNAAAGHRLHEPLVSTFLRMQKEVEIGQIMDLADTVVRLDDPHAMIDNCLAVFRWKTASYTTIAPLELGFLAAGIDATNARRWAERIGTPLGTAFQLADDLIDVDADNRPSGKPLGGDIREGKHTVLLADALLSADRKDAATLRAAYSAPERDASTVRQVIDILGRSGAIDASRRRITTLWNETSAQLDAWHEEQLLASSDAGEDERLRADAAAARLKATCALFLPSLRR